MQEAVRDTWIWRWLDELLRDVRYAMRSLTRSWGFTAGAGTVLALTIGANIAIFSVVNTVLLQPLAYPDAERLVSVETLWTNTGRASQDVSGPDFLDWQAENDVFEQLAAYLGQRNPGHRRRPGRVCQLRVRLGRVLRGVRPERVRGTPADTDDVPAEQAPATAAVVAYHWAATHFGSDRAAIGKTITVYGDTVEIVGVATPGFRYPGSTDIWSPMRPTNHAPNRSDHPYQSVGKLKEKRTSRARRTQMQAIGDALAGQYPENRFKTATVIPLQQRLTGSLEATLWVLMSAVGVVWLIGCANIANLLLARAAGRTREIALRAALGAGRVRVMRQLLTESCVLAGGAGLAGLLLASLLVQGVVALSPANVPHRRRADRHDRPRVRARALAGVDGALRARAGLHASRLDLSNALKQGGSKATASRPALGYARCWLSLKSRCRSSCWPPRGCWCDRSWRSNRLTSGSRRTVCWWRTPICGQGRRHRGPLDSKPVLCRCARSSAQRAWGQRGVGRGLPGDGARAVTSRRLYSRPARGATGRAAASGVRDHRRLLQDAGDSASCRARFRPDRHTGAAAGRHRQRDPGTHRLSRGVAHRTAYSDRDKS